MNRKCKNCKKDSVFLNISIQMWKWLPSDIFYSYGQTAISSWIWKVWKTLYEVSSLNGSEVGSQKPIQVSPGYFEWENRYEITRKLISAILLWIFKTVHSFFELLICLEDYILNRLTAAPETGKIFGTLSRRSPSSTTPCSRWSCTNWTTTTHVFYILATFAAGWNLRKFLEIIFLIDCHHIRSTLIFRTVGFFFTLK